MATSKSEHGRLSNRLEDICKNAQQLLDATEGKVDTKTKEIRDSLQSNLDRIKEEYDILESRISDKIHAADKNIREKPYQAIGITLVTGLILGWLMHRK